MGYTNWLMISTMKELDLFDEIPYKHIKDIINDDEDEMEVKIEDLDCDRDAWCKTRFTFEISQGKVYKWDTEDTYKKFVVEKEYNCSSPYALMMLGLQNEDEEDEEDEEQEEEVCKDCDEQIEVDEDGAYLGSSFKCDKCEDSFCADCRSFVGYTFGIMCCKCADEEQED